MKNIFFFRSVLVILTIFCLFFTFFDNALGLNNIGENFEESSDSQINSLVNSSDFSSTQIIGPSQFNSTTNNQISLISSSETKEQTNLNAKETLGVTFDPGEIPFFKSVAIYDPGTTTFAITNKWTDYPITAEINTVNTGSNIYSKNINAEATEVFEVAYVDYVVLTISATDKDGFRNWSSSDSAFIKATGSSASRFETLAQIPDMRYFTTDETGTEAGDYFFYNFFRETKATSLPAGSFDTSLITSAGTNFFQSFNRAYANRSSLTSLPAYSFNFDNLESHGQGAFAYFNDSGNLTSLPYDSFNLTNADFLSYDYESLMDFNDNGMLNKTTSGVQIKNSSIHPSRTFYWAVGSATNAGSENISSGSIFCCYNSDPPIIYTMQFESEGGSEVASITATQSEAFVRPEDPTKSGYVLYNWLTVDGTPYDWDTPATGNLTLYANWELPDFVAIPYFKSETFEGTNITMTINNKWYDDIIAEVKSVETGSIYTSSIIESATSAIITFSTNSPSDLTISAASKDGFRNWRSNSSALITASVPTPRELETFAHIPDIRYFTTDSSGTEAGDYFFLYFFKSTRATALPPGSFDISTITKVGIRFFAYFNNQGYLQALPEGSFDTSNIRTASTYFFSDFNNLGTLTSLPRFSFNFDSLESHGNYAFLRFNYSSTYMSSLPYNSFNLSNVVITTGAQSWSSFNNYGRLTQDDSSITIRNTSSTSIVFYWANGSSANTGSITVASNSIFCCYSTDPPGPVTMSFVTNGGSEVDPITTLQGETFAKPIDPSKPDYIFLQWVDKNGDPYDWNSPATSNLTLTAQWEYIFDQIPYFRTATATASGAATFTICNHWDSPILFQVQNNGSIVNSTEFQAGDCSWTPEFGMSPGYDITISAKDKDGFRNWRDFSSPLITVSGNSSSQLGTITHIPDMRFFTTEPSGTEAGDYFFAYFYKNKGVTSLPEGSFDISTITKVGKKFFDGFNWNGDLTSLPEGSFNTSNIREADDSFFTFFNYNGKLTSLPRYSFNFDALESHGDYAFQALNFTGSLSSLPYDSFNLKNVDICSTGGCDEDSWDGFNYNGYLTKADSGVNIRNTSATSHTFNSTNGSTPNYWSENIESSATFCCYATDDPLYFTMSFDANGGTDVSSITAIQSSTFEKPDDPVKAGYLFIQWNDEFSNSYDWDTPATSDLTLTAQWEQALAYFQTQTIHLSSNATTITINNHWTEPIIVEVAEPDEDVTTITTYLINGSSATDFLLLPVNPTNLTIWPTTATTFRNWANSTDGLIVASGDSDSIISTLVHIPELSYFTLDDLATEAGNYFFQNFFQNTKATSLPEGSFDISTITNVGTAFFQGFNRSGSLQSLPDGSFDTSNILNASSNFFREFNYLGSLTELPEYSFNFDDLQTHGNYAFYYFNHTGSLTFLPVNSFYLKDASTNGNSSWYQFNYNGQLTKRDSGIPIKNTSANTQTFYWAEGSISAAGNEEINSGNIFCCYKTVVTTSYTMSFDSDGGSEVSSITQLEGEYFTKPEDPTKSAYGFTGWFDFEGNLYDWNSPAIANLTLTAHWEELPYFQTETIPASEYAATITVQNRWNTTLTIYVQAFDNQETLNIYTISASTGTTKFPLSPDEPVYLSIWPGSVDGFREWQYVLLPLVKASGTSASQASSFVHIPDMNYFTTDSSGTEAGTNFFRAFTSSSPLTSLPAGSFDTSSITTVGNYFFYNFAYMSSLTSLPAGSFNTSSITYAPEGFFSYFAYDGSLTSLPDGSFNISNIASAGNNFFSNFNYSGSLTSLPDSSFNTSNITAVSNSFFSGFAESTSLTSLPAGSFDISSITAVGVDFFSYFAHSTPLTSLPVGSFDTSSITTAGSNFFRTFANSSSLTSLPVGSFNTSNITTASAGFFQSFAYNAPLGRSNTGVSIKNASSASVTFYWNNGESEGIGSQSTFCCYSYPQFTISFDSNGGSAVDSTTTVQGEKFSKPEDPTKFAYIFNQWVRQDGNPYDWNATASADLTLTAQWNIDPNYTVTMSFDTNGGSPVDSIYTQETETFSRPEDPTKSAFGFTGWLDFEGNIYDWDTPATSNLTLTAEWETLPYFQTETIPPSSLATTITVSNRWYDDLTIEVKAVDDGEILAIYHIYSVGNTRGDKTITTFELTPEEAVDITILPTHADGLRVWKSVDIYNAFVLTQGTSSSQAGSFVHIPAMNYFTIDDAGTEAGNGFFKYFFYNGSKATSLPVGSFDISTITKVGDGFFIGFNFIGSLTSLPEGSFDTSNIRAADNFIFSAFNQSGKLTSLPKGSFNFEKLETHGISAFGNFNYSGSLTSLPINSFTLKNVSTSGNTIWSNFNNNGKLTKTDTGVSIKNTSNQSQSFFWAVGSDPNSGWETIESGATFCCYKSDLSPIPPTPSTVPKIANISPKQVQNGKVSTVVITGSNLDDPSYSFGITATRFSNSKLPSASKTYNKVFPTNSISGRTATSATLKIPKVNWVGTYTIQLLREPEMTPTKTVLLYHLPLGTAKNFTDISKLTTTRHNNVKWLAQTGVTGGCNNGGTKYCPEDPVTRGSMAVFLQLLAGYPAGTSKTSSFADVFVQGSNGGSKTVTYVSGSKTTKEKVSALTEKRIAAVNWLALTGITGGSGSAKVNGKLVPTYRPQDVVNRGSMATFMLRFSEDVASTITNDAGTGFADVKIGSGNFTITYKGAKKGEKVAKVTPARATAIRWMQTAGITGGSGTDKNGKVTYRPQDEVNRGSMATFMKNLAVYMKFTS